MKFDFVGVIFGGGWNKYTESLEKTTERWPLSGGDDELYFSRATRITRSNRPLGCLWWVPPRYISKIKGIRLSWAGCHF